MNILKKVQQERAFIEMLFEHRNKEYGAYDLRMEYDRILSRSLFLGVSLFALLASAPLIIQSFNTEQTVQITSDSGPVILTHVPDYVEPTPPAVQPPVQIKENTVKIEIPTPAREPLTETPAVSQDKIKDAVIGHENIVGEKPSEIYKPIEKYVPPVVEKPSVQAPDNTAHTSVDVEARFTGGIDSFRNKVIERFDTENVNADGVVQTVVTFIVERDGSITNIKASGANADFNAEAERTIRSIKNKWTPAKIGDHSVRSYFKFPIKMQIE